MLSGRIGGAHADDAPKAGGRWDKLREHRLTTRTAALAGPATHIPGLFYLMALNVIVAHQPKVPGGVIEVLIYNVIWFTEVCLSNVLRLENYIKDAERAKDTELVEFFRRAQAESRKGAEQGKQLLAARLSK